MAYDRNLLKLAEVPAFRSMLERQGVECRDGKGEFQLLQVRTSPQCWAVVNRNSQGVVNTHPDLTPYIKAFRMNGELKKPFAEAAREAVAKQNGQFLEDLRDDMAMAAMRGICSHADTWGLISNEKIAAASYELADAMLEARKVRP